MAEPMMSEFGSMTEPEPGDKFHTSVENTEELSPRYKSVDTLNLTDLLKQSLKNHGYNTLGDLIKATEEGLIQKVDHLGRMGVQKIRRELAVYGLTLGDYPTVKEKTVVGKPEKKVKGVYGKAKCVLCNLTFKNGQGLGAHMRIYHPGQSVKTAAWKKRMGTVKALKMTEVKRKKRGPNNKTYVCTECNLKCESRYALGNHVRWHHKKEKVVIPQSREEERNPHLFEEIDNQKRLEYAVGYLVCGIETAIKQAHDGGLKKNVSLKDLQYRIANELLGMDNSELWGGLDNSGD